MQPPRLHISTGMRQILDYPRFVGPTRVLILGTEYFFDQSWKRAAESLGWAVAMAPSAMLGGLTREQIQQLFTTIAEFKPHFILTSNYAGMDTAGIFSRFFEDARIPYVSWFTDTPRMILFGREMHFSPYSVAATWERGYLPHLEQVGFPHVFHMPLATDPHLFNGAPADTFARGLAFVGTSMRQQAAEAIEKHAHLPHVLRALEEALLEGRVTRAAFMGGLEALFAPELLAPLTASERRNLELLVNYEATRRQREALVRRLRPFGLEVRGDANWRSVHDNVQGQVGYYDDLAAFYRNTAINLNSTSLQMPYAVNQRVFDCPAAGGFLITDAQADLAALFEPAEVVVYHSLDELADLVRYFLPRPRERAAVIERARSRILAQHTHAHRLLALEGWLKERFAA
ncbi:MAG: glycosyltransferase [Candidatus Hydrogenedentes bacterium]|nr:glycosyltransferase [Candidatus Hydrogenedentota bacterium]